MRQRIDTERRLLDETASHNSSINQSTPEITPAKPANKSGKDDGHGHD
jgi:hypothetical protein